MRARRLAVALAISTIAMSACGSSSSTIGPLSIEPPEGWLVVDRQPGTIKVANGTISQETSTKAGDATAVFDIYVDSAQSLTQFRSILDEENVRWREERIEIDGYEAFVVAYEPGAFGPSSEVVFIPDFDVRIVYRAAFADQESAFARHRAAFRDALASIRFEGPPQDRARDRARDRT